ncbi:hypothetical protein Cgig2_016268 [Carnegiea gigantea]|uniref:Calmodulin-binding domain-containing protein n=1 Tax=Carnegiea gigantea TaxID=171969 RepID=A0A9Q1KHE9_9CARY|nr:hypothetical protein Cgig2_016268 [Carnegiea gigantea]
MQPTTRRERQPAIRSNLRFIVIRQKYMATPPKKGVIGKEKKGAGASPPPSTSSTRKPSKPSSSSTRTTPTSSCDHERPTTPTDTKPMPNYLKPTISSIPKRATTDGATLNQANLKPMLNRMRSFDKVPPSPQLRKAVRGSSTLGARDARTTRSSSFSYKTTTSASSSSARPVSSYRPGVRNAPKGSKLEPHSRGGKKSTSLSNTAERDPKWGTSTSSTKKAPKSVASEPCMNNAYETHSIGHHFDMDDHDMVNIDDHDLQSLPEISEMPEADQELGDPTNLDKLEAKQEYRNQFQSYEEPPLEEDHEPKNKVHEQENTPPLIEDDKHHSHDQDVSTVAKQPIEVSMEQDIETPEKPHHVEEEKDRNHTYEKHPDEEIIVKEQSSADHQQQAQVECTVGEQNQVEEGAGDQAGLDHEVGLTKKLPAEQKEEKEEKLPKQAVEENKVEGKTQTQIETEIEATILPEEKQHTVSSPLTPTTDSGSVSNSTEVKQREEKNEKQETTIKEKDEKQATTTTTTVKRATTTTSVGGKKESQQAYNDVIEETSRKLMGKKNKVLALAGAFETVISLQDTSPSKN